MRDEIERVIKALEEKADKALMDEQKSKVSEDEYKLGVCKGRYTIAQFAIHQLREILKE